MYLLYSVNVYIFNVVIEIKLYSILSDNLGHQRLIDRETMGERHGKSRKAKKISLSTSGPRRK